jgi:hypothetical protein
VLEQLGMNDRSTSVLTVTRSRGAAGAFVAGGAPPGGKAPLGAAAGCGTLDAVPTGAGAVATALLACGKKVAGWPL